MTHHNLPAATQGKTAGNSSFLILLCAPSHDRLTEYTSKLFEGFPDLGSPTILRKIESPLTYEQVLSELSIDPDTTDVALIFCGHGGSSMLLGPDALPDTPTESKLSSSFYDESYLNLGPLLMLAYCCSSAAELGDSFVNYADGRTFVGFNRKIGFVLKDGDYEKWWRNILHGMASAIVKAADIDELEKLIREIYEEALTVFDIRAERKYKYGLMMSAYLRRQLADIRLIST